MGVNLNLNNSAINKKFKEAEEAMIKKVIRVLKYCGEVAVNEAKLNGSYMDQTGNLRSSIGYVITVNGKVMEEAFTADDHGGTTSGKSGLKVGRDLAREIARGKPDIALVVVAGMKYASHVESKGRNVLTSAEQMAKALVPNLLNQLKL